jgi:uncharacterized membrane-anchored protein YhcB (DUF1043 family)
MSSFRTTGRDLFQIIVEEHRRVEQVYSEIKSRFSSASSSWESSQALLQFCFMLIRELSIHAHKEHVLVYPLFQRLDKATEMWDHALEEHLTVEKELKQIETGLEQLLKTQAQSASKGINFPQELLATITKCMEDVLHHVKEEETDLLPKLQQVVSPEESLELARKWEALTGRVGSRPHPEAEAKKVDMAMANNNAVADSDKLFYEGIFGHPTPTQPAVSTLEMADVELPEKPQDKQEAAQWSKLNEQSDNINNPKEDVMMQ